MFTVIERKIRRYKSKHPYKHELLFLLLEGALAASRLLIIVALCFVGYLVFEKAINSPTASTPDKPANDLSMTAADSATSNTGEPGNAIAKQVPIESTSAVTPEPGLPVKPDNTGASPAIAQETADAPRPSTADRNNTPTDTPASLASNALAKPADAQTTQQNRQVTDTTFDTDTTTEKPERPVAGTSAKVTGKRQGASWIMSLPSEEYIIQFASTPDEQAIIEFSQLNLQQDAVIYPFRRTPSGRPVFGIAHMATYLSLESAQQAIEELPLYLQQSDPWIRPVNTIQNAIVNLELQ